MSEIGRKAIIRTLEIGCIDNPNKIRMQRLRARPPQLFRATIRRNASNVAPEGDRHALEIERNGAQGRDRTADTAIFSRMLYQLSYLGISRAIARKAGVLIAGFGHVQRFRVDRLAGDGIAVSQPFE